MKPYRLLVVVKTQPDHAMTSQVIEFDTSQEAHHQEAEIMRTMRSANLVCVIHHLQ